MKVTFLPMNKVVEVDEPLSLLEIAKSHGIHINSICNGVPSCGECRVYIKEGEQYLFPPLGPEMDLIGTGYFLDRRRLACQAFVHGDLIVDLSDHKEEQKNAFMQKIERQFENSKQRQSKLYSVTGNLVDQKEIQEEVVQIDMSELENQNEKKFVRKKNSKKNQESSKNLKNNNGFQRRNQNKSSNRNRRRNKKNNP